MPVGVSRTGIRIVPAEAELVDVPDEQAVTNVHDVRVDDVDGDRNDLSSGRLRR